MQKMLLKLCLFNLSAIFILSCQITLAAEQKRYSSGVTLSTDAISENDQFKNSKAKINKNSIGEVNSVQFSGEKGNLKFEIKRVNKTFFKNGHQCDSGTDIVPEHKYLLVTNYEKEEVSNDEYRKTGRDKKETNDVCVYDSDGNVIFEKKGVPYKPAAISENGKVIACLRVTPDMAEDLDYEVMKNPPKAEFYVYSSKGELINQKMESYIVHDSPRISPSGRWAAYGIIDPKYDVKIIDLQTSKEYLAPCGFHANEFDEINDEGELIHDQMKVLNKKADGIQWNFTWEKIILYKVGE